jgi:DNA-binding NarL/FixJ family response regulator
VDDLEADHAADNPCQEEQLQGRHIRRLSARGTSIRDIAALLGTTKRTVSRRRASLGAA